MIAVAEDVFRRYGYGRLDTPMFEETRLFVRGVGESTDIVRKEMYTFEDMGGRSMTLRPEGTAPAARAYVEHGMHTRPQPVKLWYNWYMFRYENPQSGRYRQHEQLGIEAFGSDSPLLDAEVIGVLAALYRELGLAQIELRLNSMGDRTCRSAYVEHLRSFLDAHADELCGECRERTRLNPLRTFDCKVQGCRAVLEEAPRLADELCAECAEHHAQVKRQLAVQGIPFVEDHRLVRGMDYYTRTTFEFQSAVLGAQSGVGGGGRYDNLVEMIGGPPTPGVGFGTGVERILLALARSRDDLPTLQGPDGLHRGPQRRGSRARLRAGARAAERGRGGRARLPATQRQGPDEAGRRQRRPLRRHPGRRRAGRRRGHPAAISPPAPRSACHVSKPCDGSLQQERAHELPDAVVRRDHGGLGGTAGRGRRVGAPPEGSRGSGVHRPARPHRAGPAGVRSRGRRRRRWRRAHALRNEYVLSAQGTVLARSPETVNPALPTGAIEIAVDGLTVLAKAKTPALLPRGPHRGRRELCACATATSTCDGSGCSAT